jgi:hypothetical protein
MQCQEVSQTVENGREDPFFHQKHYLKCESCLWTTSYIDVTGYLDITGTKVQCPACKEGIVEVIETSCDQNDGYVPPSYLGFVLTDW